VQIAGFIVSIVSALIATLSAWIAWRATRPVPNVSAKLTTIIQMPNPTITHTYGGQPEIGTVLLAHIQVTNLSIHPVQLIDYELSCRMRSGHRHQFDTQQRINSAVLPMSAQPRGKFKAYFEPGSFWTWPPRAVGYGELQMGWIPFTHSERFEREDFSEYELILTDVFGRRYEARITHDEVDTWMLGKTQGAVGLNEIFEFSGIRTEQDDEQEVLNSSQEAPATSDQPDRPIRSLVGRPGTPRASTTERITEQPRLNHPGLTLKSSATAGGERMVTRGVVVGRTVEISANQFSFNPPSRTEIYRYLTYWDAIDMPRLQGIGTFIDDKDILLREGILSESEVSYEPPRKEELRDINEGIINGFPASQFAMLQVQAAFDVANYLNTNAQSRWSIGQGASDSSQQFQWPMGQTSDEQVLEIQLHGALPFPKQGTPIEQLLDFRERRREELLDFRSAMYQLYDSVLQAENIGRALVNANERLETALLGLHRVMDESKIKKLVGGVKTYLSLGESDAIKVALPAIGAASAGAFRISPTGGRLAGLGLDAILTLTTQQTTRADLIPSEVTDFAYLYYAEQ
jgi:Family of unknown function (DUF6236)